LNLLDQYGEEDIKFEDIECEPIFNARHHNYNPETHVQVRILSSKSMMVDLTTGLLKKKKKKQNLESEKKLNETGFFGKMYQNLKSRFNKKG